MSQYNAAPLPAADNAGQDATDLKLAPFLPTVNQSGDWNQPAPAGGGRPIGNMAALPSKELVSLHAKTGCTDLGGTFQRLRACAVCHSSFPNNYKLEQHASKSKHKAYSCICGCQKGFTKLSALRRHIQESAQTREHICPLCDHKCKRPGHIEQHLRLKHNKTKDEIKRLLSTQKPEPVSEQRSTAPAAVPTTSPINVHASKPIAIPDGPWTGPMGFSATAPADYPGSRPGDASVFFSALPALGLGQVTATPAFTPQNSMMHAPTLPIYYYAYPVGVAPVPTWFFANPAPAVSSYPAAPFEGTNDVFDVNPAPVPVNPADGFGMPDPGIYFLANFSDFDFNNFGI